MPLRHRIYRALRVSPGAGVRLGLLSLLVFVGAGALVALLDMHWGLLEYRWGLTVFFGFVTGFTALAVFHILVGLLGLDYPGGR